MSWLEVVHEKTFDTELVSWRRSAACVMNNGDIALWGKTSRNAPRQFHIYNKDGEIVNIMRELCPHKELVRVLSIVIENIEYLAVSCKECRDINLQHLTIDTAYPAFASCACGAMCYGKEGGIFAIDCVEHSPVIEIGCKRKQFVYGETVQTLMKENFSDLCYISTKDILVIPAHKKNRTPDPFSDGEEDEDEDSEENKKKEGPPMIRAVQCSTGKKLWEVKEVKERRSTGSSDLKRLETCAHGVVYSHKYDVLLVADGSNQRILVLQPESGEHLQTIDLSSHVGSAWQLFLHRDQLILEYEDQSKIKLAFYSVRGGERPHGYMEAACDGAAVTLSSPDSDVTLHVPRNTVQGDVAAWVHTNPTVFKHLLPNRECLISPIVMFGPKSAADPLTCRAGQYFTIQIPHAVPNIVDLQSKIRVRYGDIHGPSLLMRQAYQRGQLSDQEVSYQVNDSHITVYSRHLTGFVVTLSRDYCYSKESSIRVFGALGGSGLCLKAYLCSPLYVIKDFQEYLKRQAGTGMKCLQIQHVPFEPESTANPIEISLTPEEQENWDSAEPKTMNRFRIRCRHICDHDLKVLASYKVIPKVSEVDEFRGALTVELKRANNAYKTYSFHLKILREEQ